MERLAIPDDVFRVESSVPLHERTRRSEEVRRLLDENGCDALLVYSNAVEPGGVVYLTGWTTISEAWCLITPNTCDLVTGPYTHNRSLGGCWLDRDHVHMIHRHGDQLAKISQLLGPEARRIALSGAGSVPARLRAGLAGLGADRIKSVDLLRGLREIKSDAEIEIMKGVCRIAEAGALAFAESAVAGVMELEVAAAVEGAMRKAGAEHLDHPTAVGAGQRSLDGFMLPTSRRLMHGDVVFMDCGPRAFGYATDLGRARAVDSDPSPEQLRLLDTVRLMYEESVALLRPGVDARDAFRRASDIARSEGLEFEHELGHGVGCDGHESPNLDEGPEPELLAAGMVVAIEPGLRVDGVGKVQFEDMFLISQSGAIPLTSAATLRLG